MSYSYYIHHSWLKNNLSSRMKKKTPMVGIMLCVSIRPQNEQELLQDFAQASSLGDLVEIRVDGFSEIPFATLKELFRQPTLAGIGSKQDPELLRTLASLGPTWLDVPSDIPIHEEIKRNYPDVKIICSYHDYKETPDTLYETLTELQKHKADLIKFVTYAHCGLDGLRMLELVKNSPVPLIGFCMGDAGSFTRVLAPVFGSQMTYSCLDGKETAAGQVSAQQLLAIYHYRKLSSKTIPYALIGTPVSQSISFITHNALFEKLGMDAVYVKIPMGLEESQEGYEIIQRLGFGGISVTTPLKGALNAEIINTVKWTCGSPSFLNSDGVALLDAIEEIAPIKDKKLILLGAGATGLACAQEAKKRGAQVTIVNRTEAKAYLFAKVLGCDYAPWNMSLVLASPYDILINATTVGMKGDTLPITPKQIRKDAVIADVIFSPMTSLIEMAQKSGAKVVTGQEMWFRQAAYQFCFWKEGLKYTEVLSWLKESL